MAAQPSAAPDGCEVLQPAGFTGVHHSGSGALPVGRDLNILSASAGSTINFQVGHQSTPRPPCHSIPFPRNEALVKRDDLFAELERLLPPQTESQTAALWGLGGSGKTQIALEYAYRRWHSAPCSVFWVHADNEATFSQDYQLIAKKLGVPANLQGDELLAEVRARIEAEPSWVLVLDNVDNIGLFGAGRRKPAAQSGEQPHRADHAPNLHNFVPRGPIGTVLWTSRDEGIAGSLVVAQRTINVARMEEDEALKLLTTIRNEAIDDTERDSASALLAELDRLPLAISQAASYMRRTRTPVKEYLSKLKRGKKRWRILRASEPDVHRRCAVSNSILETWSISIEHIRQENEMAYHILHVLAFFDNQNIPEPMVKKIAKQLGSRQANEQSSDSEDEDAIDAAARLREFSFLSHRKSDWGPAYEMHKLVQEAARYRLQAKEDEIYFAKAALRTINDLFPKSRLRELWEEREKYLAHAQRVGEWADLCGEEEAAMLLGQVAIYLYDRGRWRDNEPVAQKVYELQKKILGDKHPDTLRSMANLATTYHGQEKYNEAEKVEAEVLALQRDTLGDKHPDTLRSMSNLALTYHGQKRYNEAEKMGAEVLALQRDTLGDKHPNTLQNMANLITIYNKQKKYNEAEKIGAEVLALQRDTLGDKHPDTFRSIINLAATYHEQGKHNEAEKMGIKVLALQRDTFGDKHPDTLRSMANLATTYHEQKRYNEAEKIKTEVLALQRDTLGNKHPDTLRSMANLAITYYGQERYNEAEKMEMEVLALWRDTFGNKHPDTVRSMANLAATYYGQERYNEAEKMEMEVLALWRDILGDTHPYTTRAMYNVAVSWFKLARHDEALQMMDACVQLRSRVLGSNHPDTQKSLRVLNSWKGN
ncbi:hypothetical protein RB599_011041 [Gaeumannomyces hyphopodioides]